MRIGCPTEIKAQEGRVGVTPAMTYAFEKAGHEVFIQAGYQPFMYFEKYDGVWGDLGTPPHSVVETGQPAYCLQMSMER